MTWEIRCGHVLDRLREMEPESVQCVVTSPPYFGLRDYGTAAWDGGDEGCAHMGGPAVSESSTPLGGGKQLGVVMPIRGVVCSCGARRIDSQLGLEATPAEYVAALVAIFAEVRRVLAKDGTLWLNLGDSYAGSWGNQGRKSDRGVQRPINGGMLTPVLDGRYPDKGSNTGVTPPGLKPKDLVGIPWMVAFALRADGWWLRSDIIWAKPNPMPESVTDRPTRSHEYLFLLTKSARYYYDADAVKEPMKDVSLQRLSQPNVFDQPGGPKDPQNGNRSHRKAVNNQAERLVKHEKWKTRFEGWDEYDKSLGRNLRDVWTVATQPFSAARMPGAALGGKPDIVSPDCPIHGLQPVPQTQQTAERDGQPAAQLHHIPGSDDRPDPSLGVGDASNSVRIPSGLASSPSRTPQNTTGSRTPAASMSAGGQGGDVGTPSRTNHSAVQREQRADNSGSLDPARADAAMRHSTGSHRTDPSLVTSQPYTPSAQSASGTGDTEGPLALFVLDPDMGESSTDEGGWAARPSAQTLARTQGKPSCSCKYTDHFATFPKALVEPCIKAGTSEEGCCPECRAPWVRVQAVRASTQGRENWAGNEASKNGASRPGGFYDREAVTTGWKPSCTHDTEPVPCTVLDPFCGSGTAGVVAVQLGRSFIGIDLSETYCEMAERRIHNEGGLFSVQDGASA